MHLHYSYYYDYDDSVRHYTFNNLSQPTKEATEAIVPFVAALADVVVFLDPIVKGGPVVSVMRIASMASMVSAACVACAARCVQRGMRAARCAVVPGPLEASR